MLFMRKQDTLALVGTLGLAGLCGCFSTVRQVAKVQTVSTYKTATVEALSAGISEQDAAIRTLNASVLITASTGGTKEGKVKTYTSFRGYIFVQKPRELRVILQLPYVGTRAMDMVSDGKVFKLLIPSKNRAVVGTSEMTKSAKSGLDSLRPAVFLDSLLVPGVSEEEYVTLTESTHEIEPAHGHKDAVDEPDYELGVYRRVGTGHVMQKQRSVRISRVTLLPYEQDVLDNQGQTVTRATYANYAPVGSAQFPRLITISRPLDEYALKIEVTKLTLNEQFESDQFELKIPPGIKEEHVD